MNKADKAFVRSVVLRGVNATEEWLLRIIREQEAELSALREERRERPMSEHPNEDETPVLLRVRNPVIVLGLPRVDVYAPGEWLEAGGWHTWEGNPIPDEDGGLEYLGWLPMPEPGKGEETHV